MTAFSNGYNNDQNTQIINQENLIHHHERERERERERMFGLRGGSGQVESGGKV